jgi:hypothetical protein
MNAGGHALTHERSLKQRVKVNAKPNGGHHQGPEQRLTLALNSVNEGEDERVNSRYKAYKGKDPAIDPDRTLEPFDDVARL